MQTENAYIETDLGNIALNPRGEYSDETSYEYLDTVSYMGGSYMCLAELTKNISGIAPESGENTQYWQMLTLPGQLTPGAIAMHDDIVNKSKQVETSRAAVELSQQAVEDAQVDVRQMRQDTQEASESAIASRDAAAGYAQAAEASRTAAAESEQNINAQVNNFNTHVSEKTSVAEASIEEARKKAINAVTTQQDLSIKAVTDEETRQTNAAIKAVTTQQNNSVQAIVDEASEQIKKIKDSLDKGLSEEGKAADAKATGDAISTLTEDLDDLIHVEKSKNLLDVSKMRNGFLQNNGVVSSDTWALDYYYTDIIPCNKTSIVFANGTSNVQNQLGGLYKNGKWIAQLSQNAKISKIEDTKEHLFYFKIEFLNECPDFDGIILNTIHLDNFPKKFVMLDCEEPYIYSQYVDFYVEKSMSKNIPAQSITKQLESELIEKTTNRKSYIVNCWGDSLTRGVGGGDYNSKTYPAYLQNLLGREYVVNNLGVGGEPSETIGFREGGITGYIQPCTIPESGSVDIEIRSASGNNLYPMAQSPNDATGGGVNPVSICEIEGNLSYDNSKRTVVFTRKNNGGELKINKSTPIVTNGMSKFSDGVKIIWAGTNNKIKVVASNWNMGTLSYYLNGATDYIDSVLRDIDNIIGDSKSYIVIGMTSKTYMPDVVHINKVMAHKYGRHFLDVRELLLTSGLEDAGITPTEQDGADISNNEIPTSLRSDDTHLNAKGYANIAKYVYEKGQYLKYWN